MSNKALKAGDPEAVASAIIKFTIQRANQLPDTHKADCLINAVVAGLKDELEDELGGPSENQRWYYRGSLMEDDKSLMDYGILGYNEEEIVVRF